MKKDMESSHPLDRLICGDVGFGKTEVAMRAAFKAVDNGKQVAYLAPTTVLTRQHYLTFKERFEKYGVRVELLNRFVPVSLQKNIIEGLKKGYVDIVTGTHRILSNDIVF
ncbi:MAG: DEAD/DEAH box helicase [Christensenellales bacterium]